MFNDLETVNKFLKVNLYDDTKWNMSDLFKTKPTTWRIDLVKYKYIILV